MLLKVNPHKIEIVKSPVNEREINISKCQFEFADEITNDYVKEAYFTFEGTTYKQIIVNNECDIPSEVLTEKGQVEIGVVAFKTEGAEEIKRYNPSPAYFNTWVGSLKDNAENSEPITPTDKEQVEQALNNGLNDIDEALTDLQEKVDSGYFKGDKGDKGDTGEQGPQGVQGETGPKGDTGATGNGIVSIVKTSTSGLVDTYTITFTNGTTTTFDITNGEVTREELEEEVERLSMIYNAFPSTTGEVEEASINGTAEVPFKEIGLKGNTSQNGEPTPDTPIPVNVVSGNNSIKIVGKNLCNNVALSNSNNDIFFYFDKNISQTFTLSATINSATSSNSIYLILNGSSLGKVGEITGSANTKQSVTITFTNEIYEQIQNSTTRYLQLYKNNAGFTLPTDAQIENGSSNTEYEEYKSNTYEVNLGKNLIPNNITSQTLNGLTITKNDDGSVTINGTCNFLTTLNMLPNDITIPKGQYTLSGCPSGGGANTWRIDINNGAVAEQRDEGNGATFTLNQDTVFQNVRIRIANGAVVNNLTFKPMLEKGSSKTTYSPYFTPIELNKIGDYQDRIYKNNGKWYKYDAIGKVVLDGSENWIYNSENSVFVCSDLVNYSLQNFAPYCNNYKGINIVLAYKQLNNNEISFLKDSSNNRTLIKDTRYTIASDLRTWLSTHNTTVYYILNTPTITPITDTTLIEQLDNLEKAYSYDTQTNISQTNQDKPFIISYEAILSLRNVLK